jgi:hypothetical protein
MSDSVNFERQVVSKWGQLRFIKKEDEDKFQTLFNTDRILLIKAVLVGSFVASLLLFLDLTMFQVSLRHIPQFIDERLRLNDLPAED